MTWSKETASQTWHKANIELLSCFHFLIEKRALSVLTEISDWTVVRKCIEISHSVWFVFLIAMNSGAEQKEKEKHLFCQQCQQLIAIDLSKPVRGLLFFLCLFDSRSLLSFLSHVPALVFRHRKPFFRVWSGFWSLFCWTAVFARIFFRSICSFPLSDGFLTCLFLFCF